MKYGHIIGTAIILGGIFLSIRDPGTLIPGERLFAIGASAGLQATITDGVFTGFRKLKKTNGQVIQLSAPVNPGNIVVGRWWTNNDQFYFSILYDM